MKLFYKKSTRWFLTAGTAIMIFVMFLSGRPLNTPATPGGILCLEFANTPQKVKDILTAWTINSPGQTSLVAAAKTNTYLDFIFLFFYSFFLFTGCRQLATSLPGKKRFLVLFNTASLLALAAGVLDIFENIGMLVSLHGFISGGVAITTATVATLKWISVTGVIVLMAGGLVYRRWANRRVLN